MSNTKQALVNRVRARLMKKPGAQKGFVRLYVCEAELYRRIIEKVPHRILVKASRAVIKDLDQESIVSWFGNIGA